MNDIYFSHPRTELLDLIPLSSRRILDIGCGSGVLGKSIKERQPCVYIGIELNKNASDDARKHLDFVYHADVEDFDFDDITGDFDCIILADILEHLIDPWTVLRDLYRLLSPGGIIVCSLPNICHSSTYFEISRGLFRYQSAGIRDITHLRFFSQVTAFQMFVSSGFKVKLFRSFPSVTDPVQFHLIAKKTDHDPLNDQLTIVIPVFNCVQFTSLCINSIIQGCHIPHHIVVLDNHSTDETLSYLRSQDNVFHIECPINTGFPTGVNIGLETVNTPYFSICNNDIIIPDRALDRLLLSIDELDDVVGIGPRGNNISGPQNDPNIKFMNHDDLRIHSEKIFSTNGNDLISISRLVFFCVVFRSVVLDSVGFLDEFFGMGNFDDDDYCLRVMKSNHKLVYHNGVFVFHFGSITFRTNNIDYKSIFEHNRQLFLKKHNLSS